MNSYKKFLKENAEVKFNDIFNIKNKWVKVSTEDRNRLADEFFELISIAYYPIGGHIKVRNAKDLIASDWDVWQAIDYDADPDAEIVVFGKETPYGVKWSGVGHDGAKASKKLYLKFQIESANINGNYIEVSEKISETLLNSGVPYVNNAEDVTKVLGKKIEWVGASEEYDYADGWYIRRVGGLKAIEKILVGKPNKISKNSLSKI